MKVLSYYGRVTESMARSIVRDLESNQHEADEGVYSYEHSPNYPGLFWVVKYTENELI